MIGFYSYTVVLTYLGLASAAMGMILTFQGFAKYALFCLAFSGLCDMFDGKVARLKKDRTEDEKRFGIQIDSLCDVVCFGAFPALICYLLGVRGFLGMTVIALYCVASVIRLAFFNVMEMNNALITEEGEKFYRGLPITSMAVALPLVFMIQFFVPDRVFVVCLYLLLLVVGLLFIVDFRFRKPSNLTLAFLVSAITAALVLMLLYTRYPIHIRRAPMISQIFKSFR